MFEDSLSSALAYDIAEKKDFQKCHLNFLTRQGGNSKGFWPQTPEGVTVKCKVWS
jgi:hypothetical protein